jgi:hypothetical protein
MRWGYVSCGRALLNKRKTPSSNPSDIRKKKKERKKISRNLMISIENEILYEK